MKILISAVLFFSLPVLAQARLMKRWHYQEMVDKADLVVIAIPKATKDTAEKTVLWDIMPHIPVIGVETDFEVSTVLKGDKDIKNLLLHHYRLVDAKAPMLDGPGLCDLVHDNYHSFLLFLVREPDGRYAPVGGQTDPDDVSVIRLPGGPR